MKLIVTSILLLVGAMGTACTPSLTHLVEERRFADAICLAKHQEQANVTLAAVARELEPRVLVQRAPASSWTDPMGEDGNTASEHLAAVRTMWVMNRITARSVTATVALVLPVDGAASAGRFTGGEYPRRAGVARVLGERPPKQHEESWNEHIASAPPRNPFELFLSLFQTDTIHHERLVDPAPAEWAAQAPRTTALFDALTRGANAQGFVLTGDERRAARFQLGIIVEDRTADGDACRASFAFDLPADTEGVFQRVASRTAAPRAQLSNVFGYFDAAAGER